MCTEKGHCESLGFTQDLSPNGYKAWQPHRLNLAPSRSGPGGGRDKTSTDRGPWSAGTEMRLWPRPHSGRKWGSGPLGDRLRPHSGVSAHRETARLQSSASRHHVTLGGVGFVGQEGSQRGRDSDWSPW